MTIIKSLISIIFEMGCGTLLLEGSYKKMDQEIHRMRNSHYVPNTHGNVFGGRGAVEVVL